MAVGEAEVGRIVGHGVALGGNTDLGIGDGEVGVDGLRDSYTLYRVALF